MALNLAYFKTLVAVLKLASIALLAISYSLGLHSYLSSEYNKGCMDPTPSPWTSPTLSPSTNSSDASTETAGDIFVNETTTEIVVSLDPIQTSPSSESPPEEDGDKAPILWMERFLIIVTAVCMGQSLLMFILHVVKGDLLESPKFRGVDFGYHFFGGILLIVSAIFMAYSAGKINSLKDDICADPENCELYIEKLVSAGFALISAIFFFAICLRIFGKKFYQTV